MYEFALLLEVKQYWTFQGYANSKGSMGPTSIIDVFGGQLHARAIHQAQIQSDWFWQLLQIALRSILGNLFT